VATADQLKGGTMGDIPKSPVSAENKRDKAVEGETPAEPTANKPPAETKKTFEETTPPGTGIGSTALGNNLSSTEKAAVIAQATGKSNALNNHGMGDS